MNTTFRGLALVFLLCPQDVEAQNEMRSLLDARPPIEVTDLNDINLVSGTLSFSIPIFSGGSQNHPLALDMDVSSPDLDDKSPTNGGSKIRFNITQMDIKGWPSPSLNQIDHVTVVRHSAYLRNWKDFKIVNSDNSWTIPSIGDQWMEYRILPNSPQKTKNMFCACDGDRLYMSDGTSARVGPGGLAYVNYPDGEEWRYYYNNASDAANARLKFIVSNAGFAIQFRYASDTVGSAGWKVVTAADLYNKSSVFCDEYLLQTCSNVVSSAMTGAFNLDLSNKRYDITDASGSVTRLGWETTSLGPITSRQILNSGIASKNYEYQIFGATGMYVKRVNFDGKSWSYEYSDDTEAEGSQDITVESWNKRTDPDGSEVQSNGQLMFGGILIFQEWGTPGSQEIHRRSTATYGEGRLQTFKNPEMVDSTKNTMMWIRDSRANLIALRRQSKASSSLGDLVITATYPTECLNPITCNKPTSVTDAKGNTSAYVYDPVHGGVLRETLPAVNGIAPVKRFAYGQRYARILDGNGGYVPASSPIWVLTEERTCKTTATVDNACQGGASDEIITSYDYGPDSGPNNLLLRGKVVDSGTGRLNLRTCYGYDAFGRKISETTPRAGLAACP